MTAPTSPLDRCPRCGAAVRLGDPWCTLCYADLRPEPEPEPEPPMAEPVHGAELVLGAGLESAAEPVAPAGQPVTSGAEPLVPLPALAPFDGAVWPCTTCGAPNAFKRDACAVCGASFLAAARDTGPLLELPLVGDLTRLSRGQRLALAGGVVLAVVVLTLLVGLLLR